MTQDEIIWQNEVLEMARQATVYRDDCGFLECGFDELEAFAKLVDAKATAKERNEILDSFSPEEPIENWIDKILARGEAQ